MPGSVTINHSSAAGVNNNLRVIGLQLVLLFGPSAHCVSLKGAKKMESA